MRTTSEADDRVLGATRWAAGIVAVVLTAAGVILYLFPTETARLWAWEMGPPMTSLAVGGGYLAGATFFARAAREDRWHAIGVTFVGATVLSGLLLIATVLHWDAFSHGHVSFWAWTVLYVLAPGALPLLWFRNQRLDPGDTVQTPTVPAGIRQVVGGAGLVQCGVALAFFVHPPLATSWWPWTLSPLTARTVSAFLAFIGVVWLAFLWEDRWSALRLHVETAVLGLVLVGIGMLRARGDLVGEPLAVGVVVGLLAVSVVGAVVLHRFMHRSRPVPVRVSGSGGSPDRTPDP